MILNTQSTEHLTALSFLLSAFPYTVCRFWEPKFVSSDRSPVVREYRMMKPMPTNDVEAGNDPVYIFSIGFTVLPCYLDGKLRRLKDVSAPSPLDDDNFCRQNLCSFIQLILPIARRHRQRRNMVMKVSPGKIEQHQLHQNFTLHRPRRASNLHKSVT